MGPIRTLQSLLRGLQEQFTPTLFVLREYRTKRHHVHVDNTILYLSSIISIFIMSGSGILDHIPECLTPNKQKQIRKVSSPRASNAGPRGQESFERKLVKGNTDRIEIVSGQNCFKPTQDGCKAHRLHRFFNHNPLSRQRVQGGQHRQRLTTNPLKPRKHSKTQPQSWHSPIDHRTHRAQITILL